MPSPPDKSPNVRHRKISPTFMPQGLQMKLGSAIFHFNELVAKGLEVPPQLGQLLVDAQVVDWMKRMDDDGLLPKPKS